MNKAFLDKIIEGYNGLEVKFRYGIFGGLLLMVFALDYFSVMAFQLDYLKKSDEEIKTLVQEIGQVKADKLFIAQMKKSLDVPRRQLVAMSEKVRSVQAVPIVLEEISRLANEFGVKIDQLTPQKDAQELLITAPEGKYYALPIVIQARSGYHMFGHFLNRLERQDLYFSVRDLRIEADEKDPNNQLISMVIKVILVDK